MKRFFTLINSIDWILVLIPTILTITGLIIIYSLSLAQNRPELFTSQITYFMVAIVAFILATIIDYRTIKYVAPAAYVITIILLIVVYLAGHTAYGAVRWIDLGPFQLQPAELMKLVLILTLARVFQDKIEKVTWYSFLAGIFFTIIPVGLVLLQPDLGSAGVLIMIGVLFLLASRISKSQILGLFTLVILIITVGWFSLRDYQKTRIEDFIRGSTNIKEASYNVRQSIIAVGSGGLLGQGIGRGSQSQSNFLPVAHTDFIFAATAEATGLIGSVVLLGLYVVLILRILKISSRLNDQYAMLVYFGVACVILVQVSVNIGMNIGILPVTGIPLPFVSHGGSSLIVIMFAMGMLESIHLRRKKISFS